MKKISLFIFSLISIFILCNDVKAITVNGEGYSGTAPDIPPGAKVSHSWLGYPDPVIGIRISFVTSDGDVLYTGDYVMRENWRDESNAMAGGRSIVSYGGAFPTFPKGTTYSSVVKGNGAALQKIFYDHNFLTCSNESSTEICLTSLSGSNTNNNYAYRVSLASTWFDESSYDHTRGSNYEKDLKELLKEFLGNKYDLNNEENIKKLFFVIEPTTLIEINSVEGVSSESVEKYPTGWFYGTQYELSRLANIVPDINKNGNNVTALQNTFYTAFRSGLPCSGYLKGDLLTTINSHGVDLGWASGTYFGWIKGVTTSMDNTCNSAKHLSVNEVISGNYGIGMSLVWFYDKIKIKDVTCDEVDRLVGQVGDPMCSSVPNIVDRFNNIYAEANGYEEITISWYQSVCGCEDPEVGDYNCTPVNVVNQCKDKPAMAIEYSDSEDWENCIFNDNGRYDISVHKTATGDFLTYYESALGNEYCEVYCREELEAKFDSTTHTVEAGQNFVWPQSANVKGSRTCKTKEIKFDDYLKDVKQANLEVKAAYGEYLMGLEKNEALKGQKYTENYNSCNCINNTAHFSCCSAEESYQERVYYDVYDFNEDGEYVKVGRESYLTTKYKCTQKNDTKYGYYSTISYSVNASMPSDLGNYRDSASEGGCSNVYTPKQENTTALYNSYISKKDTADALAKKIKDCYTWLDSDVYNVADNEVIINYNDPGYKYNEELEKTDPNYNSTSEDDCIEYNTKVLSCSGESCTYYTVPVKKCGYYSKEVNSSQDFNLPQGVYQYVLKGSDSYSNLSIHYEDYINYGGISYIDIGHSNLPVSYSTKAGNYPIELEYSNLGHNSSVSGKTVLDTILSSAHEEKYGEWKCEYNVIDVLMPPESYLKVIYRTIDLNNPFPDIDGTGRKTGSNWCDGTDCSNTNEVVQEVILNKKDILSQEPMYSFTLTPSLIKQIRKYNKTVGSEGYTDFNLKCENETGNACISSFLTSLINNNLNGTGYDSYAKGTCISGSVRVPKTSIYYNCRTYPNR